jgi:excisionase family DNA binding protein
MPPVATTTTRAPESPGAARRPKQVIRQARNPSPERATLTPLESTKVTGFGVQATYKLLRQQSMPSIKVGMRFFIPRVALLRWLEENASGKQQLDRAREER